jgi:hypothetical protein
LFLVLDGARLLLLLYLVDWEKFCLLLNELRWGFGAIFWGPLLAAEAVWFFFLLFRIWLLLSGAPFSGGVGIVCGKEGRIETITSWIFRKRLVFLARQSFLYPAIWTCFFEAETSVV